MGKRGLGERKPGMQWDPGADPGTEPGAEQGPSIKTRRRQKDERETEREREIAEKVEESGKKGENLYGPTTDQSIRQSN